MKFKVAILTLLLPVTVLADPSMTYNVSTRICGQYVKLMAAVNSDSEQIAGKTYVAAVADTARRDAEANSASALALTMLGYYTSDEVDTLLTPLASKAYVDESSDSAVIEANAYSDGLFADAPTDTDILEAIAQSLLDYYTKEEVDTLFDSYYTGTQVDELLSHKADTTVLDDLNASNLTSGTVNSDRLPYTGVVAGTYGDATHSAMITVDSQGRTTFADQVAITGGGTETGAAIDDTTWTGSNWTGTDTGVSQRALQIAFNGRASEAVVSSHVADTDNPHEVTKSQIGLGNVDNTSDANKPISSATQTALNLKMDADSPAGHDIQDDGVTMVKRGKLNVKGLKVTDDPTNDATVIELERDDHTVTIAYADLTDSCVTIAHNFSYAGIPSVSIVDSSGEYLGQLSHTYKLDSDRISLDFSDFAGIVWPVTATFGVPGGVAVGGGSSTGWHNILDNGSATTARPSLNFIGFSISDNPLGESTDITSTGGISGTLSIDSGGTGATSASAARVNLGLGSAAVSADTEFATAAQGTLADGALQLSKLVAGTNITITTEDDSTRIDVTDGGSGGLGLDDFSAGENISLDTSGGVVVISSTGAGAEVTDTAIKEALGYTPASELSVASKLDSTVGRNDTLDYADSTRLNDLMKELVSSDKGKLVFVDADVPEVYGDGSDGALTASTADTVVNECSDLTADASSGATSIVVRSAAGMSTGKKLLIHQTQDYRAGTAGSYEFVTVASVSGTTVNLSSPLSRAYFSDAGDGTTTNSTKAQAVVVKQYSTITVNSSCSITAKAWDGYSGGIVALLCQSAPTGSGATSMIHANAKGFRGQLGGWPYAGESYKGMARQYAANYGGGGGQWGTDDPNGGGGGHSTAGVSRTAPAYGEGGHVNGSASLGSYLGLGSGGGGPLGDGGGVVLLFAPSAEPGQVAFSANGGVQNADTGYGSGSGGCVYLKTDTGEDVPSITVYGAGSSFTYGLGYSLVASTGAVAQPYLNTGTLIVNGHSLTVETAVSVTKADIGLGNVDDTPDTGKPVSDAVQAVLDARLPPAASYENSGNFSRSYYYTTVDTGTKSLFHFEGTNGGTAVIDSMGNAVTNTGGATTSTEQFKVGSSSGYFPDASKSVQVTLPFTIGTGDFCLETWVRPSNDVVGIFELGDLSSSNGFFIQKSGTSWRVYAGGNNYITISSLTENVWNHLILDRASGTLRVFIDGHIVNTTPGWTYNFTSADLTIGKLHYGNYSLAGYIDELRVSSISRYTEDFVPSDEPLDTLHSGAEWVPTLQPENNLSELSDTGAARDNIGLGYSSISSLTASDTIDSADVGDMLIFTSSAAVPVCVVPLNSVNAIPVNARIEIGCGNDTGVSIQASTGVTLNGVDGGNRRLSSYEHLVTLRKISADVWRVWGDGASE